ncbi:hypothetical protein [Candidatus Albibeggiatoa sp. nov. BB20]|uniref:hypothetical protein n=1 Tax=Candidatus Albibeggiatoa sp. nov. BB20 TaxID=3162723 RepID=UPI00336537C1
MPNTENVTTQDTTKIVVQSSTSSDFIDENGNIVISSQSGFSGVMRLGLIMGMVKNGHLSLDKKSAGLVREQLETAAYLCASATSSIGALLSCLGNDTPTKEVICEIGSLLNELGNLNRDVCNGLEDITMLSSD